MQSPTKSVLLGALVGSLLLAPANAQVGEKAEKTEKTERQSKRTPRKKQRKKTLAVGQTVPTDLSLPTLSGKKLSFGDLRGKVVFVHWWSIRCPWEKYAEPVIVNLEQKYKGKPVVVLAINSNQNEIGQNPNAKREHDKKEARDHEKSEHDQGREGEGHGEKKGHDKDGEHKRKMSPAYAKLMAHVKATEGFEHEVMIDHGNKVSRAFGARTTPHCFVIDAKGVLQYSGALDGYRENREDPKPYVANAIDALLAGKEVTVQSTKPYG